MSYITLQNFRTVSKVDACNDAIDKVFKQVLRSKFSNELLSKVKIKLNGLSNFSVNNALTIFPLLIDLKWLLVEAKDSIEFIASDNPVIFTNSFMPNNIGLSITGITAKGLLIFFPLSPNMTLVMYDNKVYRTHGLMDKKIHWYWVRKKTSIN